MKKLITTMVRFIKTGEIHGYPVSRNPLAWLPAILYALILIPIFILILPFALIANLIGLALSRPYKYRDNQADFVSLLNECKYVHMSHSEIDFQRWFEMAEKGEFVEAAQGFLAEAESQKQFMPHSYWIYLRRLSKFSK